MRNVRKRRFGKGFTLVEAAMAAGILGLGVVSLMALCGACTRATDGGGQLSQAVFLAQEVREWTLNLPLSDPDPTDAGNPPGPDGYADHESPDDLDDLMGVTYSPPRGGNGQALADKAGWSQSVALSWVDPVSLTPVAPGGSDAVQVDVSISFQSRPVFSTGWLVIGR